MHTKGPWAVWTLAPDSDPDERHIVTTQDGETEICGICNNPDDADLIATAPEMLALLEEIRGAAQIGQQVNPSRIDALIEKALGR
jgi:hypothetical protein